MSGAAGPSKKSTVYVGGFANEVNEQQLLDAFVTFGGSLGQRSPLSRLLRSGDIIEIVLPTEPNECQLIWWSLGMPS